MNEQLDLFASLYEKPKLPKHVRLIECFAGIGAQAKALEVLGVDFEHWRTVEWSWQSITAYNAIHMGGRIADTSDLTYEEVLKRISGVSHDYQQPMDETQLRRRGEEWARELLGRMIANNNVCPDISRVHAKDLDIREREDNLYILTYSFPCQDLSLAGQMKGFEKGSGTRSGLLWEIERILNECGSELPQVLIMENVPGVCSSKNKGPWQDWLDTLHGMGYTSYLKIINAKNCSIPQNRERAFLVSILGEFSYKFQSKAKLKYLLKDFIKSEVGESYYLSDEMLKGFLRFNENQDKKGNGFKFEPTDGASVAQDSMSDANNRPCDNFIIARERDPYPLRDGEGVHGGDCGGWHTPELERGEGDGAEGEVPYDTDVPRHDRGGGEG